MRRELHIERASKEHSFWDEEEQRPVAACFVFFLWFCLCFQRRSLGFRVLGLTFFAQYQWTGRLFSFRGSWKVLSWRNGDYQKLPLNLNHPTSLYWSVTRKSDYLFIPFYYEVHTIHTWLDVNKFEDIFLLHHSFMNLLFSNPNNNEWQSSHKSVFNSAIYFTMQPIKCVLLESQF